MNIEYCKRQIQLSMLRAQWWIASATSGHYKQRQLFHERVSNEGPEFTDAEKLENTMATANRHIKIAADFSESLAEAESADAEAQERLRRMR